MRAISTEMTAPRSVLLLRSRIVPVFLPGRAKARTNGGQKPRLWTLQAPFSAFENLAVLLLVAAAAISVGIGFIAVQDSSQSVAGRPGAGAPRIAAATFNLGQAH